MNTSKTETVNVNYSEEVTNLLKGYLEPLIESVKEKPDKYDDKTIHAISKQLQPEIDKVYSNVLLKERLQILYDFQKQNLEILKDYKEEIKFATALQEDIRKERAKFFAETLKEVAGSLKETGVEDKVKSQWIKELVSSYTQSLDLSNNLVKENTMDITNEINDKIKSEIKEK